ncbi:MAG: flagellar hook capping protein [candidate division KSB1 bacterium]|nr:flagellar hook capping protein [candidate division KSB1 bacterium]
MDVPTVNSLNTQSSQTDSRWGQILGKDDFLKLLLTQLKYQDPLEPMENTEFVAQLAQFTSLEQLQNMDGSLQTISLLTQSVNSSLATNLIGKYVKTVGNGISLSDSNEVPVSYNLSSDAKVTIEIYNSENQLVRTLQLGAQAAGDHKVVWDGKDNTGTELPPGEYTFKLTAIDGEGKTIPNVTYTMAKVTGIKFENSRAILLLGGEQEVNLSEVLEIRESS